MGLRLGGRLALSITKISWIDQYGGFSQIWSHMVCLSHRYDLPSFNSSMSIQYTAQNSFVIGITQTEMWQTELPSFVQFLSICYPEPFTIVIIGSLQHTNNSFTNIFCQPIRASLYFVLSQFLRRPVFLLPLKINYFSLQCLLLSCAHVKLVCRRRSHFRYLCML